MANESEKVVNHPVQRRIALILMLFGNAGIISAVSSLILTAIELDSSRTTTIKIVVLVAGLVVLWGVANSKWVDQHLSRLISWALKRYTRLDIKDYASLLRLRGDCRVSELQIEAHDWMSKRPLKELALDMEGLVVLDIERAEGHFVGAPKGDTRIRAGDTVLIYGRASLLEKLGERRKGFGGDREHRDAVAEHEEISARECREDDEATCGTGER